MGSLHIPKLFETHDNGYALPTIRAGNEWVLADFNALMTIKLDGIAIEVGWDNKAVAWTLTQLHSNSLLDVELKRTYTEDQHIWRAFDGQQVKSTGRFVMYGRDINNNPHRLVGTYMTRMNPVVHDLLIPRHKTIVPRSPGTTVGEFYSAIAKELEESPEIHGFVFHREDDQLKTRSMAKVTREEFGLEWPIPVKQLSLHLG